MEFVLSEEKILKEIEDISDSAKNCGVEVIFVTNELGLGVVPENRLARHFRDIAGKVNQILAKNADEVHFVVSGIPVRIK